MEQVTTSKLILEYETSKGVKECLEFNSYAELFDYITSVIGWGGFESLQRFIQHTPEEWSNRGNNYTKHITKTQ
jgi:hypothetical protein